MSNLGMGVMIKMLGGNKESVEALTGAIGKTITQLRLGEDDALHFTMDDNSKIKIFDDGQCCCAYRYMRTDDKLTEYVGAKLLGAEIKSAPNIKDECGYHEVEFLEIKTDRGVFTMASHNEHNGYYGGFNLSVAAEV